MNVFCIIGKSGSGKDTIYKRLIKELDLDPVPLHTTRPMRPGEINGKEYFFVEKIPDENVIELREYETTKGIWKYALIDNGQFQKGKNKILITTPSAIRCMIDYWDNKWSTNLIGYRDTNLTVIPKIFPILIEVEDGERLIRSIRRERDKDHPDFEEICRRYIADKADFAFMPFPYVEFKNEKAETCIDQVKKYIENIQKYN